MSKPTADRFRLKLISRSQNVSQDAARPLRLVSEVSSELRVRQLRWLLTLPGITDVLITGPDRIWVEDSCGLRPVNTRFGDEDEVRSLAQYLALLAARRLDSAQPYVDGWLPSFVNNPVRLHAILPPLSPDGTCISLRVLRPITHDMSSLRDSGMFDDDGEKLLRSIVYSRSAFLISGSTGSGKSTLLAALLGIVPINERIVCVEDVGELQPRHPQFVRLISRESNVEGRGHISMSDLVKQALRMRPDRLIVGEVRGSEVCDLLNALNTGHEGGAGTVHANSVTQVPARMEALAALSGLSSAALHRQLAAAIQVVIHVRRDSTGLRRLHEIGIVHEVSSRASVKIVWRQGKWIDKNTWDSVIFPVENEGFRGDEPR